MSLILNGTDGVTFNDASLQGAAASPFGLKNRIINGAMAVDQRNAGASVATSSGTEIYSLDRWQAIYSQTSKYTVQQDAGAVTPPVGFNDYLGVTSTSAYAVGTNDYFSVRQHIEGYNIADLGWGTASAKTITLSFWVRSSLTGTFGGALVNGAENRSYPFSYTVSSANTWTQISITIVGDTSGTWLTTNGQGVQVRFGLGSGATFSGTSGAWAAANIVQPTSTVSVVGTSGATFYITGVQLEQNTSATPFERRLYGHELINCQRYYARLVSTSGNYAGFGAGYYYVASTAAIYVKYPVAMRAAPTASISNVRADSASGTSATTLSTVYYGSDAAYLNIAGGSSVPVSSGSVLIGNNNANAYVDFSAEL